MKFISLAPILLLAFSGIILSFQTDKKEYGSNKNGGEIAAIKPSFETAKTFNYGIDLPERQIDSLEMTYATRIYDRFPALLGNDKQGVKGFFFDPVDFGNLTKLPNVASFFMRMAIRNYADSNQIAKDQSLAQYTIIIVPVAADSSRIRINGEEVAYDFVCPCPAITSCCPSWMLTK